MSRKILTIEQAIDILPQKEQIHCFINAGFGLVGADWNKEKVVEALKCAEVVEIGGEQCKALKHALVCIPKNAKRQSDLYFFESRVDKIDYYEELLGEQQ